MLYNIKTGFGGLPRVPMSEIAILVSSLSRLVESQVPFVFADRHALLATAQFSNDLNDLGRIDWPLLCSRDFKRDPVNDPGKVERYQAEALVYRQVPVSALLGIACYDLNRESQLRRHASNANISLRIAVKRDWYF